MFLEVCRSTGLDPFLKEIYFVPEKSLIMASRDGYLRVANEHPQFDGMDTCVERDEKGIPIKAICSVWRKDRRHAITCEAYYSEYRKSGQVWSQYPSAMISKVAEVLALKRSFAINGVVTQEEVGEDAPPPVDLKPQLVPPQPVVAKIEELPEYEYIEVPEDESVLEAELRESIAQAQRQRPQQRRSPEYLRLLAAFDALAARYSVIGMAHTFLQFLAFHGIEDAAGFPDTDGGLSNARECYKRMLGDIRQREAKLEVKK
jgi:hypothetical protein